MDIYATYEGQEARDFARKPVPSGGAWPEVVEQVQRLEVWMSHVDDPGDDHYVLIAFDADDREISRKRLKGYWTRAGSSSLKVKAIVDVANCRQPA